MRRVKYLIISCLIFSGCASSGNTARSTRDSGSTYERRASFEENRRRERQGSGQWLGPVIALPVLWYTW